MGDTFMARSELTPQDTLNKKIVSANLNNLLNSQNKKQIDIHRATKIPKSTLTGYFKGTSLPTLGNVQKLADFFNVLKSDIDPRFSSTVNVQNDSSELMRLYDQLDSNGKKETINFIKKRLSTASNVIKFPKDDDTIEITASGVLSAGVGEFLDDSTKPFTVTVHKPVPSNYDYAFQINGHSMEPVYQDKQVVFVKKEDDYRDGQIIAAVMDGCAYLKKLSVVDGEATLVSLNPQYPNIKVDKETGVKILGVVFS
ncbi:MAG: LexA family transcriptional regulator [Lactobacillus sp.]|nr:MAG: LexA family transcriptional regulator [Lactobacillus sp.]